MIAINVRAVALVGLGVLGLPGVVYAAANPITWVWDVPNWEISSNVPELPPMADSTPGFSDTGDYQDLSAPGWVTPLVITLIGIGVAFLLGRLILALWRAAKETRGVEAPERDSLEAGATALGGSLTVRELTDVVAEALRRLDQASVPDDAIIQAWVSFEEAAARLGITRPPSWTPTEFTTALLTRSDAPPADVETLRRLYSRARFSALPTRTTDVLQVRDSLQRIAPALRLPAPSRLPVESRS